MRGPAVEAMLEIDERHWWWVGRRRILRDQIRRLALPAGASLLDAGCGSGADLEMLSEFGAVSGIDLSEQAAAHARERGVGEVRVGPIEELPWAEASFDLVTCLDVLEHIRDDRGALRELRRVTRPSGRLVLTVPAYQVLWSAHDVDNGHCRRYGRRALREAAREAGWKVE